MPHAGIRPLSGSFHLESQYGAESKTPSLPGASGCGKSARRIARFLSPDEEQISLSGIPLFDNTACCGRPLRLFRLSGTGLPQPVGSLPQPQPGMCHGYGRPLIPFDTALLLPIPRGTWY